MSLSISDFGMPIQLDLRDQQALLLLARVQLRRRACCHETSAEVQTFKIRHLQRIAVLLWDRARPSLVHINNNIT